MKKKLRVIQDAPKSVNITKKNATAVVLAAMERNAEKEFRLAVNRAMKQYKTAIKNLAGK